LSFRSNGPLNFVFIFILDGALERSDFQIGNEERGANDHPAEIDQHVDLEKVELLNLGERTEVVGTDLDDVQDCFFLML